MIREETTMLAIFATVVMTTAMISSMTFATPALALGHFNEPSGLTAFGGLPEYTTSDMSGFPDEDNNSGYDTFLDGGTNNALSGFPDEEKIGGLEGGLPTEDKTSGLGITDEGDDRTGETLADSEASEDSDNSDDNNLSQWNLRRIPRMPF